MELHMMSTKETTRVPLLEGAIVGAGALLALGVVGSYSDSAAVIVLIAVAILLVAGYVLVAGDKRLSDVAVAVTAALAGLLFLIKGYSLVAITDGSSIVPTVASAILLAVLVSLAWRRLREGSMSFVVTGSAVVGVVALLGIWVINALPEPGIDVYHLHIAAADAIADGLNPYVHASAVDTSPIATPGSTVPYPYPPLTALVFSLSTWLFGDPRWAAVIGVTVAAAIAVRSGRRARGTAAAAITALLVAFAAQVGLPTVLAVAWTEPISLPLLLGGALLWRRSPTWSGVLLGLAFATKQYFIFALPLLVLARGEGTMKRFTAAVVTAGATLVPGFLWDPSAAWDSLVVFLLNIPSRPDAGNLAGLGIEIPILATLGLTVVVAVLFGLKIRSGSSFLIGLAATLGTLFAVTSQAFANYWFLVAVLVFGGVGLTFGGADSTEVAGRHSDAGGGRPR